MTFDDPLLVYGIMLLILLFSASLFFGVRIRRRSSQDKLGQAQYLGFTPLDGPWPDLLKRLSEIYTRSSMRLELENVFFLQRGGADIYLYDLRDINSGEAFWFAEDALLIVSPALRLPDFTLLPRPYGGLTARTPGAWMLERAMMMRVGRVGHTRVVFSDSAWFDERFFVTGLDEDAVRALLTHTRRSQLVQYAADLEFFGRQDMLAVRRIPPGRPMSLEQLRLQVSKAMAVYEILR